MHKLVGPFNIFGPRFFPLFSLQPSTQIFFDFVSQWKGFLFLFFILFHFFVCPPFCKIPIDFSVVGILGIRSKQQQTHQSLLHIRKVYLLVIRSSVCFEFHPTDGRMRTACAYINLSWEAILIGIWQKTCPLSHSGRSAYAPSLKEPLHQSFRGAYTVVV